MYFHYPRARITAGEAAWTLEDISLAIQPKSTVGIVGESGSGKSTLVRVMCGLLRHQQGNVKFNGKDLSEFEGEGANEEQSAAKTMMMRDYANIYDASKQHRKNKE